MKKRKYVWLLVLFVFVGMMGTGGFLFLSDDYNIPQWIGDSVRRVDTDTRLIAITFDDGPSEKNTERILGLLAEYDAKATFFLLGSKVERNADIVRKTYAGGHDLGNHSWNHPKLVLKKPSFIHEQIEKTDAAIRDTGYEGTIHFRAPYGSKLLVLPWVLHGMKRTHVLWDIDSFDYEERPLGEMKAILDESVIGGSIVLFHDSGGHNTYETVEWMLKTYGEQGFRFVTISELLAHRG